eukprot:6173333-Pleurochrysis_carterae.AAC.1
MPVLAGYTCQRICECPEPVPARASTSIYPPTKSWMSRPRRSYAPVKCPSAVGFSKLTGSHYKPTRDQPTGKMSRVVRTSPILITPCESVCRCRNPAPCLK